MKVVDVNVLLYAVNADSERHEVSRRWLDQALSGADTVGFSWLVVTAFVRLTTKVGLFPQPLTPVDAIHQASEWTHAPGARMLEPTAQHLQVMGRLLDRRG